MGKPDQAVEPFKKYLELIPEAQDRDTVLGWIKEGEQSK